MLCVGLCRTAGALPPLLSGGSSQGQFLSAQDVLQLLEELGGPATGHFGHQGNPLAPLLSAPGLSEPLPAALCGLEQQEHCHPLVALASLPEWEQLQVLQQVQALQARRQQQRQQQQLRPPSAGPPAPVAQLRHPLQCCVRKARRKALHAVRAQQTGRRGQQARSRTSHCGSGAGARRGQGPDTCKASGQAATAAARSS